MRILNSIKARLDSIKNDIHSKYWLYSRYYEDGIVWDKAILLEAFNGNSFQGNPYYIYLEMLKDERFIDFDIYISVSDVDKLLKQLHSHGWYDTRVKPVVIGTQRYIEALCHCKYLVNNVSFNMNFIKKDEQIYLNTWHGTPLKCLGRSVKDDPLGCNNPQRNFLLSDYLIAPNELMKYVYEQDHMISGIMPGKILLQGYPRNAIFFDEEQRRIVREKYGISDVKTIMYMPTWRGDLNGADGVDQIAEIESLAERLGDEYRVFVKLHPAMMDDNRVLYHCYRTPEGIEAYGFLNAMDILITDYSSVMFDYACTGKSVILYQYDKEEYFSGRGIYEEVEKNLPFTTVYTIDELYDAVISNEERIGKEFIDRFCKYDSITAAKAAVNLLFTERTSKENMPVDLYVLDFPVTDEMLINWKSKLGGSNYRFVIYNKNSIRKFDKVNIWNNLEYLCANDESQLTVIERIKYRLSNNWADKYCIREQKRIWGNICIGNIYAKGNKLPISLKFGARSWPEELD